VNTDRRLKLAALLALCCSIPLSAAAQTATPKSLVIAIDGARADAIEIANAPNIRSLINGTWSPGYRGAYAHQAQTIKDAATLSGPNHTSIYTSVTAAKHKVTANDNAQMAAVKQLDYLTILEQRNAALDTVKLATWSSDGVVPSAADYLKIASDADSASVGSRMLRGTYSDSDWNLGRDVDAMFVFFDDVDHAGHANTWLSPAYLAEVADVDGQVGQLLAALKARPNFANEDWQIVVTSDHGGRDGHGAMEAACYTIPFLVAGKSSAQGTLAGRVRNADTTATVLSHFGIDPRQTFQLVDGSGSYTLDGNAQGASVRAAEASLATGLVANLRFSGNYADATNRGNNAAVGAGAPSFVAGKFGDGVLISASGKNKEYLTLGASRPDLQFGGSNPSSVTFTAWYRGGAQNGDPVIFGNKNWNNGANAGIALSVGVSGSGSGLGLNLADSGARRADTYQISTAESSSDWWLLAVTIDRANGLSTVYAGSPAGKLYFIANEIADLGDIGSALPINIGQDGTGTYGSQLKASLDDIGVWRRALSKEEIRAIFNNGSGRELCSVTGRPCL